MNNYRVLARKYRPATLADLVGQDHLVRTLTNALATGRLPQAWMLTGIRGVGKTTTARIIAKALNCERGPTADICQQCESCIAIRDGRHMDVIEMDAASNTGVDSIREVIDGARYAPTTARYKIYIIDEVHMLSKSAFNALLKTLEEPPAHTKFVFATTEIRKVPLTILSRTQRFDLRRLKVEMLAEHLQGIASKEGFTVEDEALTLLARAGDGSVRDALSLLDQAIAVASQNDGTTIRAEDIKAMLGLGDQRQIWELLHAITSEQSAQALGIYQHILQAGGEAAQLCLDLLQAVLALTKRQLQIDVPLNGLSDAEYTDWFKTVTPAETHRLWQILSKGYPELGQAPQPAASGEMLILRCIYAHMLAVPAESAVHAANTPSPRSAIAQAAPSPQPASQPANDATPPSFKDFNALVKWVEDQREGLLASHLYHHVKLVQFAPPKITLSLLPNAPAQLPRQLAQFLQSKTGEIWQIETAANEDATTLAQAAEQKVARQLEQAAQDPLVMQALAAFPGAKMVAVTAPAMHNALQEEISDEL